MDIVDIKPGHWYVGVACHDCKRQIAISEIMKFAPMPDSGDFSFEDVRCPHCGYLGNYLPVEWIRLQGQKEAES